jgi:hypothetical protein
MDASAAAYDPAADVDLTRAERLVPVLRIADGVVPELPGTGRHPLAYLSKMSGS